MRLIQIKPLLAHCSCVVVDNSRAECHGRVKGRVQGVGFRYFCRQQAEEHGLTGWVKNEPNGTVVFLIQGTEAAVAAFLAAVRKGPSGSVVESVDTTRATPVALVEQFEIRR